MFVLRGTECCDGLAVSAVGPGMGSGDPLSCSVRQLSFTETLVSHLFFFDRKLPRHHLDVL